MSESRDRQKHTGFPVKAAGDCGRTGVIGKRHTGFPVNRRWILNIQLNFSTAKQWGDPIGRMSVVTRARARVKAVE